MKEEKVHIDPVYWILFVSHRGDCYQCPKERNVLGRRVPCGGRQEFRGKESLFEHRDIA